ncbi:hypothetical protein DHC50_11845 [Arenibacter sp. A80]|nr:hypothetical protein [Arenibacter sp. A80]RFT56073.1 hypothetical protein D0S24_11845 [Arenibacter sp. P308M17]
MTPTLKGEIKENQAPLPTGQASFRVWGKTDFPINLVKTIFVMYLGVFYNFSPILFRRALYSTFFL